MKHVFPSKTFLQLAGLFVLLAVVSSWQPERRKKGSAQTKTIYTRQDTIVPKSAYSDQIDFQLNLDSVMQQVNIALSKIDYQKMNADVQKAMAQIDYNKINTDINKAMKDIDWGKMKMDVSRSLDSAKMAIDKIDWNEMKAEMSQAQTDAKTAMTMQKINADSIRLQIQRSLKEAQKSLETAKIEFGNYKALTIALQKDGLLQAGKPYTIQLKEGILYINGVKQTKPVSDKYSNYYPGKKNFSIRDDGKEETDL